MAAVIVVVLVEVLFDATSSSPIIASVGSCSVGTDVVDNDVDAVDGAEEAEDDANATDHRHGCKRRKVPMGLSIRERRA